MDPPVIECRVSENVDTRGTADDDPSGGEEMQMLADG